MMAGIASIPLVLAAGMAVDYSRFISATRHLQEIADAGALAIAASVEKDETTLRQRADEIVASNQSSSRIDAVRIASLEITEDKVDLRVNGALPTIFMGIVGVHKMDTTASALAVRAVTGSVEVALVLDNTFSMSETDAKGVTKLASLKTAAKALVTELMRESKADVRIGLVPYADYINVGTQYRKESWLSIPADYTVPAVPKSGCRMETVTVAGKCLKREPNYDCSTYVDGVLKPKTCTGKCTENAPSTTKQQEVCDVTGKAAVDYKWYGCIGSRMTGKTRLDDKSPSVPYPGYVETSKKCLSPIVTLTDDKDTVTAAIDSMVFSVGSYEPYTYIPAGLIWGVNVLSPTAPLTDGAAYDAANKTPRKAIVLMTDGENTMKFRASDGRHVSFNINDEDSKKRDNALKDFANVNSETEAICTYAKSNKIEIFTVAFMVDNADAKKMMQACATDAEHYFDASDPDKLLAAFSGIARSLSLVRLAR